MHGEAVKTGATIFIIHEKRDMIGKVVQRLLRRQSSSEACVKWAAIVKLTFSISKFRTLESTYYLILGRLMFCFLFMQPCRCVFKTEGRLDRLSSLKAQK